MSTHSDDEEMMTIQENETPASPPPQSATSPTPSPPASPPPQSAASPTPETISNDVEPLPIDDLGSDDAKDKTNESNDDAVQMTMMNMMKNLENVNVNLDNDNDHADETSSGKTANLKLNTTETEAQIQNPEKSAAVGDVVDGESEQMESDDKSSQLLAVSQSQTETESTAAKDDEDGEVSEDEDENEPMAVDDEDGDELNSSTTGVMKEPEDLEDGELEDEDDDEPVIVKIQPTPEVTITSSSKSSKHSSKDKEKEKDKDKERHSSRRRGSTDKDKEKKRSHHHHSSNSADTKSKKSKLDPSVMMAAEDDDEAYLFVRGGSPSHAGDNNNYPGYPADDHRPPGLFDVVVEGEDGSPPGPDGRSRHMNEGRGGRRQRSPPGNRRRREENQNMGRERGERPAQRGGPMKGRNKEAPSMGDKMIHAAGKQDQICSYYMQGKCQKSHDECNFSHNAVPPRKMELCKFWMMECCAKKEKCLYLHNDFPCKYYHTGLICKAGEKCKFSHKPLNEVTKAVLLKHIETAPKEILGDFPRLNRNGALTLINKMEARILGKIKRKEEKEKAKKREQEEREQSDHPRRSRWEQPTSDDNEKLQELMKEAGIEGFYKETLDGLEEQESPQRNQNRDRDFRDRDHRDRRNNDFSNHPHPQNMHNHPPPRLPLLSHPPPPINTSTLPPPSRFQPHHMVHNPALASVLANLNIPSTTIDPVTQQPPNINTDLPPLINGALLSTPPPPLPSNFSLSPPVQVKSEGDDKESVSESKEPGLAEPPEHLPPKQRELFLRIQQQQLKHEEKQKSALDDEEVPDDRGWYSSDEEEEKKPEPKKEANLDFSSVLSAIRQTAAASSASSKSPEQEGKNEFPRGDVDLRSLNTNTQRPQGPFGDTDFRLPSHRPEFKDIDLRLSNSAAPGVTKPDTSSPPPMLFKSLPSGPAKEIDASLKSHPPIIWKVYVVAGSGVKPDYTYIRHTLRPSQIVMDPRLGPRPSGGAAASAVPDITGPASPPQQQTQQLLAPPATIPGGDVIVDPRVNRRNQQAQNQNARMGQGQGQGLLGEAPGFGRDPRGGAATTTASNLLPPQIPTSWPTNLPPPDIASQAQAALAAQFLAAQQLSMQMFPFPGAGGAANLPFGQDFANLAGAVGGQQQQQNQRPFGGNMNQGGEGRSHGRGGGHHGRGGGSSWDRYAQGGNQHHHQQHHAGLSSPPL